METTGRRLGILGTGGGLKAGWRRKVTQDMLIELRHFKAMEKPGAKETSGKDDSNLDS